MDKKNTILGIICIAGGLFFMFTQQKELSEQQRQQALEHANEELAALEEGAQHDCGRCGHHSGGSCR